MRAVKAKGPRVIRAAKKLTGRAGSFGDHFRLFNAISSNRCILRSCKGGQSKQEACACAFDLADNFVPATGCGFRSKSWWHFLRITNDMRNGVLESVRCANMFCYAKLYR